MPAPRPRHDTKHPLSSPAVMAYCERVLEDGGGLSGKWATSMFLDEIAGSRDELNLTKAEQEEDSALYKAQYARATKFFSTYKGAGKKKAENLKKAIEKYKNSVALEATENGALPLAVDPLAADNTTEEVDDVAPGPGGTGGHPTFDSAPARGIPGSAVLGVSEEQVAFGAAGDNTRERGAVAAAGRAGVTGGGSLEVARESSLTAPSADQDKAAKRAASWAAFEAEMKAENERKRAKFEAKMTAEEKFEAERKVFAAEQESLKIEKEELEEEKMKVQADAARAEQKFKAECEKLAAERELFRIEKKELEKKKREVQADAARAATKLKEGEEAKKAVKKRAEEAEQKMKAADKYAAAKMEEADKYLAAKTEEADKYAADKKKELAEIAEINRRVKYAEARIKAESTMV